MLLVGVISHIPSSFMALCARFVGNGAVTGTKLTNIVVLTILLIMIMFIVVLRSNREEVTIRCSGGMRKEGVINNRSARVPLGIGATKMVPIVFSSSLVRAPVIVTRFLKGKGKAKVKDGVLTNLGSGG